MTSTSLEYPDGIDLDNCAREPIHIIGKSQAYGVLLVCDPSNFQILQAGQNSKDILGIPHEDLLQKGLSDLLDKEEFNDLKNNLDPARVSEVRDVNINGRKLHVAAHFSAGSLILDLEPLLEKKDPFAFQRQLAMILDRFQAAGSVQAMSEAAVTWTRQMFGFDRVMIYRFDEQWNGEVIAESKEEEMDSWLGLHYPATDIPEQSRKLFLKHPVRLIFDVDYTPVPIIPEISPLTREPLDISRSALRAVSPIHIEYLKNMGVGASLSAAIIVNGKLWGLLACHHRTAKYLDFYQRENCRIWARIFSTELTLHESGNIIDLSALSENIRRQLVQQLNYHPDIATALCHDTVKFTDLISCGGGAIFLKGSWEILGNTPSPDQLNNLLNHFIKGQPKSLFLTRNLSEQFPEAKAYRDTASGVLSLKISGNKYFFWFRPEEIQEVNWGGDPRNKAFYNEEEQRLSPRRSFEKWTEKLTGTSQAWTALDCNSARALRENVSYKLLTQQREEIEALNTKLLEANQELELFSYGLSHDLRAPIRGMEGFLTILEEDHGQELSDEGQKMLKMTRALTEKMNQLIDNILEYSRLSHIDGLESENVNTSEIIQEVLELFNITRSYPNTKIEIQPQLPEMKGDRRMLFQLWANLISNALKYSAEKEIPTVEVGTAIKGGKEVYFVKDNGIGIKPDFREKVFETFIRAVGSRFKGSGIGLAIVKKIVEKHGGEVWVESEPDHGSEFYFYLQPLNLKNLDQ